jgi:hypothetical protein
MSKSDLWCPRCQGVKRPSEVVCLACGILARYGDRKPDEERRVTCRWCGGANAGHTAAEAAFCARQAEAWAKGQPSHSTPSESTQPTLGGTP